jgi:peptidyl-prolyl cis-trans isomerase D
MSFIQDIREKYAKWAVVAIALSLLGFIMMDALVGRTNIFSGGPSTSMGKVNGKKVDISAFNKRVQQQENYQAQQRQGNITDRDRRGIYDAVWNDMIAQVLLEAELNKLGLHVGKKEINDILFGANPPQDLRSQFTDEQTGQYDAALAQQQINEIKKRGTAEQIASLNEYINQLEFQRLSEKYNAMLANSANFPRWFLEKQNADKSLIADISYIRVNYSDTMFVDSLIQISDKEILDFIGKRKHLYQQEETRSIQYVSFSAKASAADSVATREKLLSMKAEFDTTKDIQRFFAREGNRMQYYDGYTGATNLQAQGGDKDSIIALRVGGIHGPYLNGPNYVLAKKMGEKRWPDTVKVRHILIGLTQRDEQGNEMPIRDTTTAKNLADSLMQAIARGSDFNTLCQQFSEDPGSKEKGGVYDNVYPGQMVPEFNQFIFDNRTGTKGVVKTQFGYHYIEILSQKGSSPVYNIAYLARPVEASQETDNLANNNANKFAGEARTQKLFEEKFDSELAPQGIMKLMAGEIKKNDYMVGGLFSRQLVKNVYDAKVGDVLQPVRVGDDYIVAVVIEANKKGLWPASKARPGVEPVLRNRKKAEIVKKKLGNITTLDAAAATLEKTIEKADSIRLQGPSPALGFEPKVLGAAFNPDNKGKTVPQAIEGVSGIYVIRVESIAATAVESANVDEQRRTMYQTAKQSAQFRFVEVLKAAASIKDYRDKHL